MDDAVPDHPPASTLSLGEAAKAVREFLDTVSFVQISLAGETTGPYGPAGPAANALRSALLAAVWDSPFGVRLRAAECRQKPGRGSLPSPWALRPPRPARAECAGTRVSFDLTSLWTDPEAILGFRAALEGAAASGIGARRAPIRVVAIDVSEPRPLGAAAAARWDALGRGREIVQVRIVTPTLIREGKERVAPDPTGLALTTLARVRMLAEALDTSPPRLPFKSIAGYARATSLSRHYRESWRNVRSRRHQAASGKLLPVEGSTGRFSGLVLEPLGLLLAAAEVVQVGKGTTWGQGVVDLSARRGR